MSEHKDCHFTRSMSVTGNHITETSVEGRSGLSLTALINRPLTVVRKCYRLVMIRTTACIQFLSMLNPKIDVNAMEHAQSSANE